MRKRSADEYILYILLFGVVGIVSIATIIVLLNDPALPVHSRITWSAIVAVEYIIIVSIFGRRPRVPDYLKKQKETGKQ